MKYGVDHDEESETVTKKAESGESAPSLEERLKRLEEIVRSLEAADLEMEGALTLFEEGVEHVRGAEATLRVAELKVEELLGSEEDPVIRPLDEDPE